MRRCVLWSEVCFVVIARSASDEAIHFSACGEMDCFASLAMTAPRHSGAMRQHRTRNLEIPRCAIAHLRSGPSDHPGMTARTKLRARPWVGSRARFEEE